MQNLQSSQTVTADRKNARRSLGVFHRAPAALAHLRRGTAVIKDRESYTDSSQLTVTSLFGHLLDGLFLFGMKLVERRDFLLL